MAEIVVLIHFAGEAPPSPALAETPAGLRGASVWRRQDGRAGAIVALRFESEAAAEISLRRVVEETIDEADDGRPLPNVVEHLVVEVSNGRTLEATGIGDYAIFGRLVSDPGYGEDARASGREFLPTFADLPGFQGYLYGHNQALEEETMAILLSNEPPPSPMPSNVEIETEVYRRIG